MSGASVHGYHPATRRRLCIFDVFTQRAESEKTTIYYYLVTCSACRRVIAKNGSLANTAYNLSRKDGEIGTLPKGTEEALSYWKSELREGREAPPHVKAILRAQGEDAKRQKGELAQVQARQAQEHAKAAREKVQARTRSKGKAGQGQTSLAFGPQEGPAQEGQGAYPPCTKEGCSWECFKA